MRSFLPLIVSFFVFTACNNEKDHLFHQLDADYTGITFSNDIAYSEAINPFNFTNFYNGGGVGIADFNLDGIPDICFTANQKDPELYLGKGQLQFEKVEGSGLESKGWAFGISIVDINQDGWPDIYISMARHTALESTVNQLYINQQTEVPSFREAAAEYGLDFAGFTMQTVFFDYDRDGDLDAFLLNTDPDSTNPNYLRQAVNDGTHPSTDKLFENTGKQADGTYRYVDVSAEAGVLYEGLGLGVALADFNQDGFTDVYCSNDFQSDDALYLNQGDGTFKNVVKKAMKHTSLFGMGVDAADFNNDQRQDIFQLDMLPEGSERQKQMIARGDYEKKRLSTSSQYAYNLQYMRNMLQVNQGLSDSTPFFSEQGFLFDVAATDWSWSVLMADYDLDGWKDVFVTNGYRKNMTDLDFISYNSDKSLFGNAQTLQSKREEIMAAIPEIKLRNYAFKNMPGGEFKNVSALWGLDLLSYSNGAAYADLDLDGDLDLVVNNIDEPAFVFENRSTNKHFLKVAFKGPEGNREGIGVSVKACQGDSCQVYDYFPARGFLSSMNTPLVIGLGNHQQLDRLEINWPDGKQQVLSQIPADQQLVIDAAAAAVPVAGQSPNETVFTAVNDRLTYQHRESNFVDFLQTPTLQKMLTRNGPPIEKADFNADGRTDVIIGGAYQGSPTVIFYQQGDGQFVAGDTLPTEQLEVGALAILDVNQDKRPDIFIAPGASERPMSVQEAFQPLLFLNTSNGFHIDPTLPEMNICSESVLVHDFNEDGQADLLLGGSYIREEFPKACASILLEQQNGSFRIAGTPWLPAGRAIKSLATLDIDQDEDLDIVFTGHWQGVGLLRKEGVEYKVEELDLPVGWWNCIKVADIDRDGDPDLVLGNEGLNSIYKASPDQPVSLYAKDFNGDGRMDPIWVLFLEDREVAIHPLRTLTDQIVQYKKRFTRFGQYAEAELDELFTSGDLKGAMKLQVTELRSGVALNDGKGQFTFSAFPFSAQEAPVNDILSQDLNADGHADLLLVGNCYANEPVFGQSDASFGTFLRGRGDGTFSSLSLERSGLKLDGDARKILFMPEEVLIMVTQNEGRVQAFSVR